jgi:hypothetical protein
MACRGKFFRSWTSCLRFTRRSLCSSSSSSAQKNPAPALDSGQNSKIEFSTPKISNYRKSLLQTTDFEIPLSLKNNSSNLIVPDVQEEERAAVDLDANEEGKKKMSNIEFSVPIIKPNKSYHQHVNDSLLNKENNRSGVQDISEEISDPKDGCNGNHNGNSNESKSENEEEGYKFGSSHVMCGLIGFFLGVATSYVVIMNQWIDINPVVLPEVLETNSSSSPSSFSTPPWLQLPKK